MTRRNGSAPRCPDCSRASVQRQGEDAPTIHHKPTCPQAERSVAIDAGSTFTVLAARSTAAEVLPGEQPAVDVEIAGMITAPGEEPAFVDVTDPLALQAAIREGAVLAFRLPLPSAAALITTIVRGSLDVSPQAAMALARTVEVMLGEVLQSVAARSASPNGGGLILPPGFVVPGQ